jgi:high-affinity Fe2+/Pb2+ permease
MQKKVSKFREIKCPAFYLLVGCLVVIALSFSLATRVFHLQVSNSITIQSISSQGIRQHMDSDAVHWVPPLPQRQIFEAVSFYPRIAPAGPPLPALLFDKSLYNRPPPSC